MSKLKKKFEWVSNGREPYAFGEKQPRELFGRHAKLIECQLGGSESIEYCIYAPRMSSTVTPFGLKSQEASCGLCVTDTRFVITRDRHVKGMEPTVISIDFDELLYFNIGKALLLGWFSINYSQDDQNRQENIFFSSISKHHFEKALRSCKKYWGAFNPDELGVESFSPAGFIYKIQNKIHAGHVKTLMSSGEKCLFIFSCQYVEEGKEGKQSFFKQKPRYIFSDATCLLTNKSLLLAHDSLGGGIDYGTDVIIIPLEKIKIVDVSTDDLTAKAVYRLKIYFKGIKEKNLEILLVSESEKIKFLLNVVSNGCEKLKRKEAFDF